MLVGGDFVSLFRPEGLSFSLSRGGDFDGNI